MVNNYPEYAAGISYQKAESNAKHFYNAQVKVDPSDDSMSAVLTKDGEIISELPGEGGGVTVEALNVTENGTYSEEGKAYSPVVVNVAGGSSDFSTAEVTIINNTMSNHILSFINLSEEEEGQITDNFTVNATETIKVLAVFYKNYPIDGKMNNYEEVFSLAFSGDIADDGDGYFIISGAGTITITNVIS